MERGIHQAEASAYCKMGHEELGCEKYRSMSDRMLTAKHDLAQDNIVEPD